jgi:hypothetical protein
VYERNGRHEETRTPDLYRVNLLLLNTFNNLTGLLGNCQIPIRTRWPKQEQVLVRVLVLVCPRPSILMSEPRHNSCGQALVPFPVPPEPAACRPEGARLPFCNLPGEWKAKTVIRSYSRLHETIA